VHRQNKILAVFLKAKSFMAASLGVFSGFGPYYFMDLRLSTKHSFSVRYSRLSRVRYQLGHRTSVSPWEEADKIALDSNYMAVDVVINWAADGLVLCFLHAVTDLTPNDNDEQHKSQWTNWCGTPWMGIQQIELLYQRLLVCIPQTTNPSRVFQILSNEDEKSLLLTWPPDQGQGREYAKLVEAVNIRPTEQTGAKTSCTRRYKALQNMPMGEIESIIIPHGQFIRIE